MRFRVQMSALPVIGAFTSVLALAPGLFPIGPPDAWAARPHPLFGRSVLGNSAEVFLLSPKTGATGDFLGRVLDYTPGSPALASQPALNVYSGEPDATVRYSVRIGTLIRAGPSVSPSGWPGTARVPPRGPSGPSRGALRAACGLAATTR